MMVRRYSVSIIRVNTVPYIVSCPPTSHELSHWLLIAHNIMYPESK